ncbi:substrate-binding domain-containing protein [Clostridiales bacterium F-3ap]|uniref:Substrate-binding domain-containing protein n=2 Tax=Anaerotalea alkaliphila TaxID=2662126 RepID=A0A7X5KLT4_9FIRM|nr:substrate-binding domain-containing protein [Anaerotalea alkaliphila]
MLVAGCAKEEAVQPPVDGGEAGGGETAKELTIGFVVKGSDEHWIAVEQGAKQAAEDFGVKLAFTGPAKETMIEEHTGMIENNITNKVDALCVAPVQPAAQAGILKRAVDAGIPLLLIDTDADVEGKTAFLGTGNYAAAELAGTYIGEKLSEGAKVVIIRGALGDKTHDDRTAGAKDKLEAMGLEVIDVQPADSDSEKAANVMENMMQTHETIDAVFVTADQMALGALQSIQKVGKSIMLVGFDGSPGAVEKIKEGVMEGSVAQNPYQMGYLGVQNAIEAINGNPVDEIIDTGAKLLTKENIEE